MGGPQTYIYNPASNTWSQTGTKLRGDQSDEEAWVKLPDNSILSYDIFSSVSLGAGHAQRYIPSTGTWVDAGTLPAQLSYAGNNFFELGPALLLPDGRVFYLGANGNTAYYTPSTNTWAAGPSIPNGLVASDDPAAMLPNGHELLAVSPAPSSNSNFPGGTRLYEFDPVAGTYTDVTPDNFYMGNGAYTFNMLVLPTGQVAMVNDGGQIDVYTPAGSPNPAWAPTITNITYSGSNTYTLTGTQLNGISEGAAYGDDNQMASNYPIVQFTSQIDGSVHYARSFNWSSTGVATGNTSVSTQFTPPPEVTSGTWNVAVIANGIASPQVSLTVATPIVTALETQTGAAIPEIGFHSAAGELARRAVLHRHEHDGRGQRHEPG